MEAYDLPRVRGRRAAFDEVSKRFDETNTPVRKRPASPGGIAGRAPVLGIVGGGQLARMLAQAASELGVSIVVLEEGARGHTAYPVTGLGAKGVREGDITESGNIQIDVIVPEPVAARLLERLVRDILPHFATVVYESDVRVLRQETF